MSEDRRAKMLEQIRRNIELYGHHIYAIPGSRLPRYAYTIGRQGRLLGDLVFAGGEYFKLREVSTIINDIVNRLSELELIDERPLEVGAFGSFIFRKVDPSWSSSLMLGALDYYSSKCVLASQVVPLGEHWTADVPDMSVPWNADMEPIWRWVHEPWPYSVPETSIAVTNLDALRGNRITEAARWEESQWEIFAGHGPDVPRDMARFVPLGVLLGVDPSLRAVLDLAVGEGICRNPDETEWRAWFTK